MANHESQKECGAVSPNAATEAFSLPGAGVSALLIHGLTGTPYDMRYLGERLSAAEIRAHGVRLAGHARPAEELGATRHADWYESVVEGFEYLRTRGDPIVVVGLSMGAMLAARLAGDQGEAVAGLVMLAPSLYLRRSVGLAIRLAAALPSFTSLVYLRKTSSDIHDNAARSVHPSTSFMPIASMLELRELQMVVRPRIRRVMQPALVIHSRRDHTCPMGANVDFLMAHLGSAEKRAVILDESYHVISVDSEKERVAAEVVQFVAGFRAGGRPVAAEG